MKKLNTLKKTESIKIFKHYFEREPTTEELNTEMGYFEKNGKKCRKLILVNKNNFGHILD